MAEQPAPTRTVGPVTTASAAGLAASIVICYTIEQLAGIDIPALVENAAAVLLTVSGGYLVLPGAGRRRG